MSDTPNLDQRLKVLEAFFAKMESSSPAELREMKRAMLGKLDQIQDPEAREALQRLFSAGGTADGDS